MRDLSSEECSCTIESVASTVNTKHHCGVRNQSSGDDNMLWRGILPAQVMRDEMGECEKMESVIDR